MNLHTRVFWQQFVALLNVALLLIMSPGGTALVNAQQGAAKIPNDQLDSLVAPIALHPDPLLAQMLAASTYPLEIVQLQQWLQKNSNLKDKALADAVMKQPWDASVQAMAAVPDAVKQLAENINWTTDLGNAFLAQQSDVMDAVQRMRAKAQGSGKLKSSEQQIVETKVVENKSVVVIEQANPQVVYVPSYDPVVVYGAPVYPYPPVYYPYGHAVAAAAIGFGVGLAIGAAWGGGWGYGCGWGGNNNININNNNNFINNSNRNQINGGNRNNVGNRGGNNWSHNPQHRGGTPYSNRATADRFGGQDRASAAANRQATTRQNQGQAGVGNRQQPGVSDRASSFDRQPGASDRSSASNRQAGATDRSSPSGRQQPSASDRGGGGGPDRVGDRSAPSGGGRDSGAFGGGSGGFSGSSARSSSSRGASSMGSRGGGGGGGSRGGGGGRRR